MANKIKETLGYKGRKQEWQVCPLTNLLVQNPAKFVAPATDQVVGEPFVVKFSTAAAVGHSNTVVYTCPTGWTVQVLDFLVIATSAVGSAKVQPLKDSTALCDAVDSAAIGTPAGWGAANCSWTAMQLTGVSGSESNLRLLDSTGASTPSRVGYFLLMRTA